ncbi:polyphosphate kinase [Yersinia rochesterensis]|uniref:polyphosphate kinase n=1 Tax=Yersinia rochesterensis TaxID=1604335 RepID=UPI00164374B1|nr:polyphosphate kinase [Yersinia rochesterensis]
MLSKEQLEKIANQGPVDVGGTQNPIITEMATELLSLREQLEAANKIITHKEWLIGLAKDEHESTIARAESAEQQLEALKALPPVAEVVSKFGDPEAFGEREIKLLIDLRGVPYGTQLFTAAKPSALPRHTFSMLVNELRDVPAIGCKRELIVSVLNRHGVIAELVGA